MEINELSLDIETYSSEDLSKTGVYRYAESPDAELLLMGVSVNGGPVRVIDVANGEAIPDEILMALADGGVIKWAFNASFERVFLSVWMKRRHPDLFRGYGNPDDTTGDYLNPASWRCSMVWSAYMGLPLSLKGVGAVLKLDEQKMKEGSDLIRYFCVPCRPTRANGGRTRNLPMHAPDKWEMFRSYNRRDVEVELAIKEKLRNFPVPDFIWEEYAIDQQINDRGIALDMTLVRNAISFDERSRNDITARMRSLTSLENPNSVVQMKAWLSENGMEMESLGKKDVSSALTTAEGDIGKALSLRLQLAKSSVKKYQAMANAVCADGRARGMFMFYGANRTGRWCLAEGSMITVRNGDVISKKPIEEVTVDDMVWDGNDWVHHEGVVYSGEKEVITWDGVTATPEHMVWVSPTEKVTLLEAKDARLPLWKGNLDFGMSHEDSDAGSVSIARTYDIINAGPNNRFMADCRIVSNSGRIIQLQNLRRNDMPDLDVARKLVRDGDYEMLELLYGDVPDTLSQLVRTAFIPKQGYKFYVADFSAIEARVIAHIAGEDWRNELFAKGGDIYCQSASQMFKVPVEKHGINGHLRQKGKIAELACIAEGSPVLTDKGLVPIEEVTTEMKVWDGDAWVSHDGVVYRGVRKVITYDGLTATPDHMVWTEGRSVPIPLSAAKKAGARLISSGWGNCGNAPMYGNTMAAVYDILNAGPNHRFTVSGHLVHNCGYGGSVGALKAMGALEMGLQEEELQPLVDAWRSSNPNIVRFWWEVDEAVRKAVMYHAVTRTHGLRIYWKSGMLFITLPSGRNLVYVKPRMDRNNLGRECITYEGIGATKKWERLESYGPKFVENIVQAISRDLLMNAMRNLHGCLICAHVHDEVIVECRDDVSLDEICRKMAQVPEWMPGLKLDAAGYVTPWYCKD